MAKFRRKKKKAAEEVNTKGFNKKEMRFFKIAGIVSAVLLALMWFYFKNNSI